MSGFGRILFVVLIAYVGADEGHRQEMSGEFPISTPRPTTGNSSEFSFERPFVKRNGFIYCRRKCDGRPRTCYFRLRVEPYSVLGGACRNCAFGNKTDCLRPQCVTANGFYRSLITINRQLPAPPIHVCRGDRIVADVENSMIGDAMTVHWHGLRQINSQYYDGAPYVTQCPIQPGTTFRYIFTAAESGTFFYHSHIGIQKMDGMAGAFIVRDVNESQSNLYTDDLPEHTIFIGDWTNRPSNEYFPGFNSPNISQGPDAFLINGKGMYWDGNSSVDLPIEEFVVQRGRKYRFRLIGGTCMTCGTALKFQGHRMTAISADGNLEFSPTVVDSVVLNSADRFDVILEANQPSGIYFVFAEPLQGGCSGIRQIGVLRYSDFTGSVSLPPPPTDDLGVVLNAIDSSCDGSNSNKICMSELQGISNAPTNVNSKGSFLIIALRRYAFNDDDLFAPGTYQYYDEPVKDIRLLYLVNNISSVLPPSPLISQFHDIPRAVFCRPGCYSPKRKKPCRCVNYYKLPYNTVINILIYNTDGIQGFAHPYHLHGYNFYIIKMGRFPNSTLQEREKMANELMNELIHDQVDLQNRPQRDTISVPPQGWVMIRFISDNPGYWLNHCHFGFHSEAGMHAVFRIGDESLLPPVPRNFPRCGNYLPPF